MKNIALTLPGGGARAAYQAGVLRGISDICQFKECPFKIISGISAGGINGMWLATGAHDFQKATYMMWDMWKQLKVSDVYETDSLTLLKTGASWIKNLTLGGWVRKDHVTYLLDTTPLRNLLRERINFQTVKGNIESGLIYGLSLSASDYKQAKGVTFFDGNSKIQAWEHPMSRGVRSVLTEDHVLASAAIPIFFPPIRIGDCDYGDGGIGLKTPLSPAIRMGAEKLLVIGVQNPPDIDSDKKIPVGHHITIGDVAGALLNSLFLNSLDADLDRMKKMNHTASIFTPEQIKDDNIEIRAIPVMAINPSRDLSVVGDKEFETFPFTIRHLLKGLGVDNRKGWNLLSYLAFDQVYSAALLDLGYNDALNLRKEIIEFFSDTPKT